MKLPKIEFIKFGEEPKKWLPFCSQFRRIHDGNSIEIEDKFQYLIQFTSPKSWNLLESYPPTWENYPKAIKSLKLRVGKKYLLIKVYFREILKLALTNNISQKRSLSNLHDQLDFLLLALETFNIKSDTYAALLCPIVETCLYDDVLLMMKNILFKIVYTIYATKREMTFGYFTIWYTQQKQSHSI